MDHKKRNRAFVDCNENIRFYSGKWELQENFKEKRDMVLLIIINTLDQKFN